MLAAVEAVGHKIAHLALAWLCLTVIAPPGSTGAPREVPVPLTPREPRPPYRLRFLLLNCLSSQAFASNRPAWVIPKGFETRAGTFFARAWFWPWWSLPLLAPPTGPEKQQVVPPVPAILTCPRRLWQRIGSILFLFFFPPIQRQGSIPSLSSSFNSLPLFFPPPPSTFPSLHSSLSLRSPPNLYSRP
ncbi:hypothetical protein QBC32DRAFT_34382 [Pseudoneurospora amorphoporcata]|uniref:Secreted protein n=1 Tax=Pseudoneurospora amorphoporcata TaxID=241081 RepID=A0AAN6P0T3_9PEZI|nr:hypothetical protein QBC32DRAFT_34382 [Pseudoneurospora amorphoporcata]